MRLVPTFDDLADAQGAINAQHPSLSDDPPATTLANETDGTGRRVLRLTTQQIATLVHGLAMATSVERFMQAAPLTVADVASEHPHRVRALERLISDGVRLFERLARARDDAPETWKAICEWQTLASAVPDPDVCWHCHVCLTPAPRHCESCPPVGECDVEGCDQPGCEVQG